jgi:hypothetical protein
MIFKLSLFIPASSDTFRLKPLYLPSVNDNLLQLFSAATLLRDEDRPLLPFTGVIMMFLPLVMIDKKVPAWIFRSCKIGFSITRAKLFTWGVSVFKIINNLTYTWQEA